MDASETLEDRCADAWPALVEAGLGQWRLRAAGGFTGRANSALAIGDPGMPGERALTEVCEFAHVHGIEPIVQTVKGGEIEPELGALGWRPYTEYANGHEVSVLVGPLTPGDDERASVLSAPTAAWWELCCGSATPTSAQRHVLGSTPGLGYGVAESAGRTVGAARGAIVGDLLHVARLAVRPAHRRQGLAAALMGVVGAWAGTLGATRCVLQVSVTNTAALTLYERLGFTEHHRYRYWVPVHRSWKDRLS